MPFITNKFKFDMLSNYVTTYAASLKVILLTSTASPPTELTNFVNQITTNEVVGAWYSRQVLGSPTVTERDGGGNDDAVLTANDMTYTSATVGTAPGPGRL